jgi:ubiquitin carboxyl-terminal hydrolase 4/11/15
MDRIDSSVSKANPDKIVDSSAYLLFYRRRSDVPLGGRRFKEIIDAFDNPTSDDENSKAGEGQRLGEGSSPTGSSSAFQEHAAGATHLRQIGTAGGSGSQDLSNPRNGIETLMGDDGLARLSSLTYDDKLTPVQRSIEEDEGIDMTENEPYQAGGILNQSWDFKMLPTNATSSRDDVGVPGSPFASGAATDEAQHDSSGDDEIRSIREFELDADIDMNNIPGTSHYELGPAPEGELPAYTEPPPPDFQEGISRDVLTRIWDKKQAVLNVPAEGEDQQSEEAAEIHIDDEDDKAKPE